MTILSSKTMRQYKREKRRAEGPRLDVPHGPPRFATTLGRALVQGAWKDRACFVVGGGPSLIGFDWSQLEGELTIAVNRAFEYFDPAIHFMMDAKYWNWMEEEKPPFTSAIRERHAAYNNGLKVMMKFEAEQPYPPDILSVEACKWSHWTNTLADGIAIGNNSGHAAMNLAFLLGADPIYMLGFDYCHDPDKTGKDQTWFHSGYPDEETHTVNQTYLDNFNAFAKPALKASGRKVFNCSDRSKLKGFPLQDMNDLPRVDMPTFVSFATQGTDYENEQKNLIESLKPWGLKRHLELLPPLGNWHDNAQMKPGFIHRMVREIDGPVVWVDSDATVNRYPALFDGLHKQCDVAFFQSSRNYKDEFLGGTIYLSGSPACMEFLDEWENEVALNYDVWDTVNAKTVIEEMEAEGRLRCFRLPDTYCAIFDWGINQPVIEHWQASRRLRGAAL